MSKNEEIKVAVIHFLTSYSPPRAIAGRPEAMAEEVIQITAAVARFAPRTGFSDWWPSARTIIVQRMKTRAWPLVSEVEAACRIAAENLQTYGGGRQNEIEDAAIARLEDWYRKHGNQAPGQGKPSRTAELIKRGVLRDVRHARACGFELTSEQIEMARLMPMGPAEQKNHDRIMRDLAAIGQQIGAHGEEFAALRKSVKPNDIAAE